MRPELVDDLTRVFARQRTRRSMLGLLIKSVAAGTAAGLFGREPTAAAATLCDFDAPTTASLNAAAGAITVGAKDVPLSPAGCVRLRKSSARGLTQTTITFSGLTARRTTQLAGGATVIEEHDIPGGPASARISYPPAASTPYVVVRDDLNAVGAVSERTLTTLTATAAHIEIDRPDSAGILRPFSVYDATLDQGAGGGDARPSTVRPNAASCSPAQQAYISGLFGPALDQGMRCLHNNGATDLESLVSEIVTSRGVTFTCAAGPPADSPDVLAWVPGDSWATWGSRLHVILAPGFFDLYADEAQAALFHELLHARMGAQHQPQVAKFPRRAETDQIYSCISLCFGLDSDKLAPPTRCACATCLRTTKCDKRCIMLPDCDPGLSFQCPCPTGPNPYKQFPKCSECLATCPSGLSCFAFSFCQVVSDVSCPGQGPVTCP